MARRDAYIALAVFLAAVVLRAALVASPVHDYDEGVYWQSLLAMHDGYAQYRDIFVSQPPFFLDFTYLFFIALGKSLAAARIAGVFGSLLTVACGAWIAYRIAGRTAGEVALALLAFNNVDFVESVTLQAESLAIGLATLSVALVVERYDSARNPIGTAAAAGAIAAAAILVKLLAIACVAPFLLYVVWKRDTRGLLAYAAGALIFGLLLLAPHLSALHEMVAQTVAFHLSANMDWPTSRYAIMAMGLQAPLLLLCAAGIVIAFRRQDVGALSIAAWFAAVFATFFRITPLFAHHLDAIQAPLAVLGGYAIAEAAKSFRAGVPIALITVVLAVEAWYGSGTVHRLLHPRSPGVSAAQMAGSIPAGRWVITDLQATAASAGFQTPPDLVDTSLVRIRSGNLRSAQLIRDSADSRVGAVVFGGRRLNLPQLRPFVRWVHSHFHRRATPSIWVR